MERVSRVLVRILGIVLLGAVASLGRAMPMPGDGLPNDVGVTDNSGANVQVIPIPVPPGTGGFGPNLSLAYSSQTGDGAFGVGWNVPIAEIRRAERFGIPTFNDATETFDFNGQKLVKNVADSTATRTRYHEYTEAFRRILHIVESGQDFWEVTQPDGIVLRFGIDAASRVLRDGASGPISRWLLREMESPDGNVILFDHSIEEGASYLLRVRYSYRGAGRLPVDAARVRQVEFVYVNRADPSFTFTGASARRIAKRASEIRVTVGSQIFRRMKLTYADEPGAGKLYVSGRSRLASVQVFGVGDTEALPAQRFEYAEPTDVIGTGSDWKAVTYTLPSGTTWAGPAGEDRGVRVVDINGDGAQDLVRAYQDSSGNLSQKVYINNGAGFSLNDGWSSALPSNTTAFKVQYTLRAGPGNTLVLNAATVASHGHAAIFRSDRLPRTTRPVASDPLTVEYAPAQAWSFADVNGDGRADLIGGYSIVAGDPSCAGLIPAANTREVWLNTGSKWVRNVALSTALPAYRTIVVACSIPNTAQPEAAVAVSVDARQGDFNGDGKVDLFVPGLTAPVAGVSKVILQDSTGTTWAESAPLAMFVSPASRVADINRDGLADLVVSAPGGSPEVYLNAGTGWCSSASAAPCGSFGTRYRLPAGVAFDTSADPSTVQIVDIDGDGFLDLLQIDKSLPPAQGRRAWLHDPKAPGGSVWALDARFAPPKVALQVDFDFDGVPDLVDLTGAQSYAATAYCSDLLTRFRNGQGGQVDYAYKAATVAPGAAVPAIYPPDGQQVWTTTPVLVERVSSGTDLTTVRETYGYGPPSVRTDLRLSQGYGVVNVNRQSGSSQILKTATEYAQVAGIAGKPVSITSVTGPPHITTFRYDVWDGANAAKVGPGSTSGVFVGQLSRRSSSFDYNFPLAPNSGAIRDETFEYAPQNGDPYNGYGYVTRTTVTRPTGTFVTTTRMRAPDTTKWIVGLPEQVVTSDGGTNQVAKISFQYDGSGKPSAATAYEGPRGNLATATPRTTTLSYDAYGNLRSQADPAGRITEFCYDGDSTFPSGTSCSSPTAAITHGLQIAIRDPLGQVTTQNPDPITGQTTEIKRLASGDSQQQTFDPFGRLVASSFTPSGQSPISLGMVHYFDADESPIGQAYVENLVPTKLGSVELVRSASYLDGFGREVRTVWDAPLQAGANRYFGVAQQFDAVARTVTTTYPAACGNGGADPHCAGLFSGTQPRTVQLLDIYGRVIRTVTPDGMTRFSWRQIVRKHPDASANATWDAVLEKDPRGNLVQRIYDGDRLVWVEDCSNNVDPTLENLTNFTCSSPKVTFNRYEPAGQLAEVYDPEITSYSDRTKATLRNVYDSLGRVSESYDINKNAGEFNFYDPNGSGNLVRTRNARGQDVTYAYDALDRPTSVTFPSALGTRRYDLTYDPRTQQVSRVDQLQTAPSASTLSVQQFSYDVLGRRVRESVKIGTRAPLVTEFDVDLLGRASRIRTPDSATELAYDYEGPFLRRVCELAGGANCTAASAIAYLSNVEYDTIGRQTALVGPVPSGAPAPRFGLDYNSSTYRLSHVGLVPTAGTGVERLDLTYTYDAQGQVLNVVDGSINSGAADVPYGVNYTYDGTERLIKRVRGSDTKHFTISKAGNLTGKQVGSSGSTNQTYDATRRHRILTGAGLSYTYDADGNVTGRGTQRFIYDALQRLECMGTTTATCPEPYLYGLDGIRIASDGGTTPPRVFAGDLFEWEPATGAGTVRVFALGREIAYKRIPTVALRTAVEVFGTPLPPWMPDLLLVLVLLGAGSLGIVLPRAGLLDGIRAQPLPAAMSLSLIVLMAAPPSLGVAATLPTNQGVYRRWVWEDPVGSGVHITDAQGVMVHQRSYEPFGEIAKERTIEVTERTFAEHRFEDSPGLYYMNARWYDPAVGRFLSVDPVIRSIAEPQSVNGYSYVENNPSNFTDPTGSVRGDCDRVEEGDCINDDPDPLKPAVPDATRHAPQSSGTDLSARIRGIVDRYRGGPADSGLPRGGSTGESQADCPSCHYEQPYANPNRTSDPGAEAAAGRILTEAALAVVPVGDFFVLVAESRLLGPAIKITSKGFQHVLERHAFGRAAKYATKSIFNAGEDIASLIRAGTHQPLVKQANGNFARIFDAGREIGIDRATGAQTSIVTVITSPTGELITAFPGLP